MNRKTIIAAAVMLLLLSAAVIHTVIRGISPEELAASTVSETEDLRQAFEESNTLNPDGIIELRDEGSSLKGLGAEISGSTVTITRGGTFRISGSLSQGQLVINTLNRSRVILVLDNASITNTEGPAILSERCRDLVIYLPEGTESTLISGTETEICAHDAEDTAEGGALTIKDDALITGNGLLNVCGYIHNGIHGSDTLTVENVSLNITAVHHGLKGKDLLKIAGADITVLSGRDGLRADEDRDESFGNILMESGSLRVTSYGDAVSAYGSLDIKGGLLNLKTIGIPSEAPESDKSFFFPGFHSPASVRDNISLISAKGLKAGRSLSVSGGTVTVDAADDALHSDGSLLIAGGHLNLTAADDGIHAETELLAEGGSILITGSYEGLECPVITVNGGNIDVTARDDGLNCSGTVNDAAAPVMTINGGTLLVNASGDGLDSNGDLIINGGTVIVDGPADAGNGALDSGSENGGRLLCNGGTVLAIGAYGMAEVPESESGQCAFGINAQFSAGSVITVTGPGGEELISYTAKKSGSSVVFSSPELKKNTTASVSVDDVIYRVEQTETTVGGSQGFHTHPGRPQGPGQDFDPGQDFGPGRPPGGPDDFEPIQKP